MPFQPINFAGIPPQRRTFGVDDLMKSFEQSYKLMQMPDELKRQKEAQELANAFQKMKMQQYPREQELSNALTEEKIKELQRKQNTPYSMFENLPPGDLGQILGSEILKNTNPELYEQWKQKRDVEQEKTKELTRRYKTLTDTTDYRLMTPAGKNQTEGWLRALGYDDIQNGINDLRKAGSLANLAESKGVDISTLQPNYAPTAANITATKNRSALISEIDALTPLVSKPMAKVQPKIFKYSPSQIAGAIGNMSTDDQAQILAARALQPEMASLRFRALQGTVGIEAVRELTESSLGNLKIFESLVKPEVYEKMQKYMSEWIKTGTEAYEKSMYGEKGGKKQMSDPLGIR